MLAHSTIFTYWSFSNNLNPHFGFLSAQALEKITKRIYLSTEATCLYFFILHQSCTCSKQVTSLSWSRNGRYLASGSLDQSLILWDVLGGSQVSDAHSVFVVVQGRWRCWCCWCWCYVLVDVLVDVDAADVVSRLWWWEGCWHLCSVRVVTFRDASANAVCPYVMLGLEIWCPFHIVGCTWGV